MRPLLVSVVLVSVACDKKGGGYEDPESEDAGSVERIDNDSDARLVLVNDNGEFRKHHPASWFVDCGPHTPDVLQVTKRDHELVIVGTGESLESACDVQIDGRAVKEITIDGNGDLTIDGGPIKELVLLDVSGNGSADIDAVVTSHLELALSGNGDVIVRDLDAGQLDVGLTGNGLVTLGGHADDGFVLSSGNALLDARDLRLGDLLVDLTGSSEATVTVDDEISGEVGGSAYLEVFGDPDSSTVEESGSGEVVVH